MRTKTLTLLTILTLLACSRLALGQTPTPSPSPKLHSPSTATVVKPYTYKQCVTTPGAKSMGYVTVSDGTTKKRLGYCCAKCKRDIIANPAHWLAVAKNWNK